MLAKGATRALFGTCLGGKGAELISINDHDRSGGLMTSPSGDEIALAGLTTSRDFPVVAPVQGEKLGGGRQADSFVTKLRPFD